MRVDRRAVLGSMVAVAAARVIRAQPPAEAANPWGSPVIDCHFHPRPTLEANLAHLNGSGCQAAYLLARLTAADDVKRFMAQEPNPLRRLFGQHRCLLARCGEATDGSGKGGGARLRRGEVSRSSRWALK